MLRGERRSETSARRRASRTRLVVVLRIDDSCGEGGMATGPWRWGAVGFLETLAVVRTTWAACRRANPHSDVAVVKRGSEARENPFFSLGHKAPVQLLQLTQEMRARRSSRPSSWPGTCRPPVVLTGGKTSASSHGLRRGEQVSNRRRSSISYTPHHQNFRTLLPRLLLRPLPRLLPPCSIPVQRRTGTAAPNSPPWRSDLTWNPLPHCGTVDPASKQAK